jgi:hypothetical protein
MPGSMQRPVSSRYLSARQLQGATSNTSMVTLVTLEAGFLVPVSSMVKVWAPREDRRRCPPRPSQLNLNWIPATAREPMTLVLTVAVPLTVEPELGDVIVTIRLGESFLHRSGDKEECPRRGRNAWPRQSIRYFASARNKKPVDFSTGFVVVRYLSGLRCASYRRHDLAISIY